MSRYSGHDDFGRREPERWDHERFSRERDGRKPVIERDIYEEHDRYVPSPRAPPKAYDDFDYPPPPGRRGERFEETDRFFAEERYGPPARRAPPRQERYYEEEDFDSFEDSPERGGRFPSKRAPPRPGLIRRQSSLDTFDRKPLPRYPREPPEVIKMPAPGRRRRSPPRYERDFEEIRVAEPDYYGHEEYRGYTEREVMIDRKRRPPVEYEERETLEVREEVKEEAPFPRKGKTKMPVRLINKRAIIELGYPFEQEGETIIILKALGKEQIDEVINVSKEMNKGETTRTTYMIEAPPAPPEEIIERREIIIPEPPHEVPRSVREWDVMSGAAGGGHSDHGGGHSTHGGKSHAGKSSHGGKSHHGGEKSHSGKSHHGKSHGGHSTHGGHSHKGGRSHSSSSSSSSDTLIIERKSTRSKSRHRSKSVGGHGAVIEEVGESNAMRNGPLALVLPHREKDRNDRDERDIKAEIKALEAEKRRLKREREHEKEHRRSSKYRGHEEDEVIIERREKSKERDYHIEKDRKAPSSNAMKMMLATLT